MLVGIIVAGELHVFGANDEEDAEDDRRWLMSGEKAPTPTKGIVTAEKICKGAFILLRLHLFNRNAS